MDMKRNSVCAVVVTYNRRKLLEQTLDALLAQTRPVDNIYIVNNASTDETADYLAALNNPKMSCRQLPKNVGGAGGFSYGMKWAFDEGHEWIWLMDDDVVQTPSCLGKLLACGEENRVILPATIDQNGSITGLAMRFNLDDAFQLGFRHQLTNHVYPKISDAPAIVPLADLSFEGPLIHRSVPGTIGFPRADLFISGDDTEYAVRLWRAGLGPVMMVREARMIRLLVPAKTFPLWRRYYQCRNELMIRSCYSASALMRLRVRLMFILRTILGYISRTMSHTEFKMRLNAFRDSFAAELPNRYLPGM